MSLRKILVFLVLLMLVFSSCVTRKKTVYFQTGEWNNPTDTAISNFSLPEYKYTIKSGDILNISLGSVTPVEFDFIAQYVIQMGEVLYLSPRTGKNGAQLFESKLSNSTYRIPIMEQNQSPYEDKQALGFSVSPEGNISLPKVGDIAVSGKTLYEVETIVEEKLAGFFENPKVRVQLLNFQFTVLGEVGKQGRFTTYKEKTTLIEALTMAGNCGEFADRGQIKVIRTVDNKTSVFYVDLLDDNFLSTINYYVHPDDVIVVPPLRAKFWRTYVFKDSQTLLTLTATLTTTLMTILLYVDKQK